jgi:hypothetical protein
MIASIVFAHVWGILQLVVLGSFARTVRLRTVLMSMAAGFYACTAVAVVLESAWILPTVWITGTPYANVVRVASYTVDPFIEEGVKLIPLVMLLLLVRVIRHQWSITDCVIVGAALGSGFGLAEDLYRFIDSTNAAWTGQEWLLRGRIADGVIVPGPSSTIVSWLPAGVVGIGVRRTFAGTWPALDPHLVLSAIGGLAVGLLLRHRRSLAHYTGIALLLLAGVDHALFNAALFESARSPLSLLSTALHRVLWFVPLVVLAVAWWLDRQRQGTIPELALAKERTTSPPILGTWRTALERFPWSALGVDAFVRIRRSYSSASSEKSDTLDSLRARVVALRDRIDWAVTQPRRLVSGVAWTRAAFRATLRQPRVWACVVLIAPVVLWLAGGLPRTSRPVWAVIPLMLAVALVWTAWNIIVGVGHWVRVSRGALADIPAVFALQLLSGVGTLALGGYVLLLSLIRGSAYIHTIANIHIIDGVGGAPPEGPLQLLPYLGPLLSSWLGGDGAGGAADTPAAPADSGQGGASGKGASEESGQEGGSSGPPEPELEEDPEPAPVFPPASPEWRARTDPPSYEEYTQPKIGPLSNENREYIEEEAEYEAGKPGPYMPQQFHDHWDHIHGKRYKPRGMGGAEKFEPGPGPAKDPPALVLPPQFRPPPPWWRQ